MKIKRFLTLSCMAILALFTVANAQDDVKISRWVIGSGGMVKSVNSDNIEMSGIVGQSAIEKVSSEDSESLVVYQGFWVPEPETPGDVEDMDLAVNALNLSNYPNPFSTQTTIKYELETASNVTLRIYDIMGNVIKVLYSGEQPDGVHEVLWNASNVKGLEIGSGSYIFEIEVKANSKHYKARSMMVKVN